MLYFDYSATTYVSDEVLKEFNNACKLYRGNPNSVHTLGNRAKMRIDEASSNIARILGVKPSEIIYTSGATESNNLAIKGVCNANKGKHIITTMYEHSSVIAPINRLADEGYDVSFVKLNPDGTVNVKYLQKLIRDDTVLVSIVAVESEVGIKQNIEEIGTVLQRFPNVTFHVDATQLIGKDRFDFKYVDLVSFSAHKFFGIKGIGGLIKKEHVKLMPLLDGGSSTTKFRSGTPALELIVSLQTALIEAYKDFDNKLKKIHDINADLKNFFKGYKDIAINSTPKSIDQILNISVPNSKKLVDLLIECGVCISTKSACSLNNSVSKPVKALYNNDYRAENSIRISISYVTTKKEVKEFKRVFDICYRKISDENENNKN